MGACSGKHKRNENESNRKSRLLSRSKREHNRLFKETARRDCNGAPSSTTLYDFPLELMDIILQKSYLHWMLYSSTKQRDEEVIRSLTSVDVCFYKRITRQRFKKAIWRYLKDFYGKTRKIFSIMRNNRNYLLQNIQLNDEAISLLLSFNCITEEQNDVIQRQSTIQDKNAELLYVVHSFNEKTFSDFIKCLRRTNQKTVARILENGGVVVKTEWHTIGAKCTTSKETKVLHQSIEDLLDRTKPRSHKTDKPISQLKKKGIEILNSHLNGRTVVVWIWCRSQAALQHLHSLYESKQLRDVLFKKILLSTPRVIVIDRSQFKKTVVERPISINFTQRIEVGKNEYVFGVTKLRNKIYVLCRSKSNAPRVILVFENRNKFSLQKKIEIQEIKDPFDIGSSENEDCLYVTDLEEKCVWKITRDTDDKYKITKWMTIDVQPWTLSVSSDGQLLMVNYFSSILMIYGSDAELIRSIQLPSDIKNLYHAVKTSAGNFIIIHLDLEKVEEKGDEEEEEQVEDWMKEDVGGSRSNARNSMEIEKKEEEKEKEEQWMKEKEEITTGKTKNVHVSELTSDGQIVLRRFTPKQAQALSHNINHPRYLSLGSDDRVFVTDADNNRVILLDSDLKLSRVLCPTKDETEETRIDWPLRLYYDEEEKHLIVVGLNGIILYTLSRN